MPTKRVLNTLTAVVIGVVAFASVACEGVVVTTVTPEGSPGPSETATVTADETSISETDLTATPDPGGTDATPTVAPSRTAITGTATSTGSSSGGRGNTTVQTSFSVDYSQFEGAQLTTSTGSFIADVLPFDHSLNSVCNPVSEGGSPFGTLSIFNELSEHGGPFGSTSPFNPGAVSPPRIVLAGQEVGHLTVSTLVGDAVDPYELLAWLGCPVAAQ